MKLGIGLGLKFPHGFGGQRISSGRFIRNVALAGDSHMNMYLANGTNFMYSQIQLAIEMYGSKLFNIIRPPTRDRFTHAIGGSRVDLFVDGHQAYGSTAYQMTELLAQVTAGEVDTVVLSLGANDFWLQPNQFDFDAIFARHRNDIVEPLLAAGAIVILYTIPPCEDVLVPPNGSPVANATQWNARLNSEYFGTENVLIFDNSKMFGGKNGDRYRIQDAWYGDGSHLGSPTVLFQGKELCKFMMAFTVPNEDNSDHIEWVSANPFQKASVNVPADIVFGVGASVAYVNRTDGVANERITVLTAVHSVNSIGGGNSETNYTKTVAANAAKLNVLVEIFPDPSKAQIELRLYSSGNSRMVEIKVPALNGATPTVTAAQVKAAWDARSDLTDLCTCAMAGDGSAITGYGKGIRNPDLRCHTWGRADAISVANGDLIRSYCEVSRVDGEDWNPHILNSKPYSSAGTAGYVSVGGMIDDWFPTYPIPEPIDGHPLVLASPWVPSTGGRSQFSTSLYFAGSGKLNVMRHGIQKLTPRVMLTSGGTAIMSDGKLLTI